jgi:glutamate-1-semialdehyde 2,1-aminomutase
MAMPSDFNPEEGWTNALSAAVGGAQLRYERANPTSLKLFERATMVMPGGNTRSALYFDPFPLYIRRSWSATLEDADGHAYLDVLGEFTAGLYGHNDERLAKAMADTLSCGISNGAPSSSEIELAELICDRFPGIERVRFCNSGTEANLYALTLARIAVGRQKIICFSGAYHGGVFMFASGGHAMNVPFDWTVCRYNDVEQVSEAVGRIGTDLAAIIVEPMMSNGGCIAATRPFLITLRALASSVGAVLIFDEVVTSRMGAGGLQGIHGVLPDLTTLGKYLGAGFSFGAFGGRADLLDRMDPRHPGALPHAGTFNNNSLSMAVGAVGLRTIFTPNRAAQLYSDGESVRTRLNAAAEEVSADIQFTGCGSVMNIHFTSTLIQRPEDLAGEDQRLFKLFHLEMLEDGIYAARRGQINLSLPMTGDDFSRIENAVSGFLHRHIDVLRATRPVLEDPAHAR